MKIQIIAVFGIALIMIGSCGPTGESKGIKADNREGISKQDVASDDAPARLARTKATAIYSALIANLVFGSELETGPDDTLLVANKTAESTPIPAANSVPGLHSELAQRLVDVNSKSKDFDPSLDVYVRLERVDLTSLPRETAKRKFPGSKGILTLSQIAVSDDLSQALLFVRFENWSGVIEQRYALIEIETPDRAMSVRFFPV
jgi:hypothetical protein